MDDLGLEHILITPEMVRAGAHELRDHHFGDDLLKVAEAVYLTMEIERRCQDSLAASSRVSLSGTPEYEAQRAAVREAQA